MRLQNKINEKKGDKMSEVKMFNIEEQRKKLNISIEELAAQMGVSSQTIRNWESKRITPSKASLILLKDILKDE